MHGTSPFPKLLCGLILLTLLCSFATSLAAQDSANAQTSTAVSFSPLITQAVDERKLTTLKGNVHPLARPQFDLGTAPASLPMQRMLLVLKRSPQQESALRKLLDDQQDKHSPNYHKWLTPEQYGKQFGPSDSDMQAITGWVQTHGFQLGAASKGRTVVEFSGSASQVQEAFHTAIHKYVVKGEQHWANASDPQIPTALTPAVAGVLSLHNFLKKPTNHLVKQPVSAKLVPGKKPQISFTQDGQIIHALGPQDYATIYNINPTFNNGDYGSGVSIGVVGRSDLFNEGSDVEDFISVFGICCDQIEIVFNGPDPGDLGGGEEAEATLDSSWAKAVAPNASVVFVVSASTNTTDGVDLSEVFIVESNFVDIMTESFSSCELLATDSQLAFANGLAEQAAAQGITYTVSTGDNGSEGCDDPSSPPATHPISVNLLASTPFNIAVGGTMFNENGQDSKYWGSEPPFNESAISYIPEDVWNESSATSGLGAGSGGASSGNILDGGTTPGVMKPAWQSGVVGIPGDGVRDLPDISLTAASHDPYLLCLEGSCVPNSQGEIFTYFISGTSASTPSFAGVMALVDAQNGGRQGQANYVLYRLAAAQAAYPSQCNGSNTSAPPTSSCTFNDVTIGNNVVPGETGTQYQAGAGYDLATGLGSINVANLVSTWNSVTFNPTTTTLAISPLSITHGQAVNANITVAPSSGTGTPTGDVSILANLPYDYERQVDGFTLNAGSAVGTTSGLPGGTNVAIIARYAGDSTYASSESNIVSVNVVPEPSTTALSVLTFNSQGNQLPFTGGPFGSFVYLRADVAGLSGHGTPTGIVTFTDTFGPIPVGGTFGLNAGDTLNGSSNTATPNGVITFDTGTHNHLCQLRG
jgi:subtilase family serine protease